MEPEHRPAASWKTISLRGLLLLVLAIGLWLGWVVTTAREQREAVAALQKFGGFVHYDWEFVNGPIAVPAGNRRWMPSWGKLTPTRSPWAPERLRRALGDEYFQSIAHVSLYVDIKKGVADATWVNIGPADDALRKLATQKSVRTLQIGGQQVTDENLSYVGKMTGLEELSISWAFHLTDTGFTKLLGLTHLRILDIDRSNMTDASLEAIGKLTNLEDLLLDDNGFTDRGIAYLSGLTRLKSLSLGREFQQISDASLDVLKNMKELERVDIGGWSVRDESLAKLRELKKLKSVHIGIEKDDVARRTRLEGTLPGVKIE